MTDLLESAETQRKYYELRPRSGLRNLAAGHDTFALAYVRQARALVHLPDGQLAEALTAARTAIENAVQSRFRLELGAAQRVLGHETRGSGPTPRVPWRLACRLLGDHDVAGAETVPWHEALADAAAR